MNCKLKVLATVQKHVMLNKSFHLSYPSENLRTWVSTSVRRALQVIYKKTLFSISSRSALGPIQPPVQRVSGSIFQGIKRQERETHHSPRSDVDVKNVGAILPPFNMSETTLFL
jgi:hypothetical protein